MARKDPIDGRWTDSGKRAGFERDYDAEDDGEEPRKRRSMLRYSILVGVVWGLLASGILLSYWVSELPDANDLLVYAPEKDITLIDAKGKTIARRGHNQGQVIAVGKLPDYVGNAFVAIEDRRFRYHFGIDPWALVRAATTNVSQGGFVQGGSTLTQQLAKNLFLKPERTIKRKVSEAILALYLEYRYSKDEILTLYLNRVYFGAGAYGIEAAAERFFGKAANELTLTEAAMLAGSVKAPSRYNPEASRDAAMERAAMVLSAMAEQGYISEQQRKTAAATRPKIAKPMATPGAGYFVDFAVSLVPGFARHANERLIVDTTLDLDLQAAAERTLEAGLAKDGKALAAAQGALVAMTPDGAVKALVGGRSYDESTFNRAIDAKRQPGSAFKPFVYLTALESGHKPSDQVFDGPVTIGNWKPDNYEGNYEGQITLAHALARSSNSASVQLTNEVGPAAVARVAHRLGIAGKLQAVPSLALGTSELSPVDLTAGYAAFANGGMGIIPYAIVRIRTASGKVLYEREGEGVGRVIDPQYEADMVAMMVGTVVEGTGRQATLGERPLAGKTGTSQAYRDAWFVGFTADYVTGVWIGNDSGAPMKRATGGGLPARIFKAFMTQAEKNLPIAPLIGAAAPVPEEPPAPEAEAIPQSEAVDTPAAESPTDQPPKDDADLIKAFENLLDKLF